MDGTQGILQCLALGRFFTQKILKVGIVIWQCPARRVHRVCDRRRYARKQPAANVEALRGSRFWRNQKHKPFNGGFISDSGLKKKGAFCGEKADVSGCEGHESHGLTAPHGRQRCIHP